MGAPELILEIRNRGCSIIADGGYLDISPADNLSPDLVQQLKKSKAEILAELQRESRRQKVIGLLEETPDSQRAFYTDPESDPDNIILTTGIRHVATFEMLIDKAKYDPWRLIELINGQTTH